MEFPERGCDGVPGMDGSVIESKPRATAEDGDPENSLAALPMLMPERPPVPRSSYGLATKKPDVAARDLHAVRLGHHARLPPNDAVALRVDRGERNALRKRGAVAMRELAIASGGKAAVTAAAIGRPGVDHARHGDGGQRRLSNRKRRVQAGADRNDPQDQLRPPVAQFLGEMPAPTVPNQHHRMLRSRFD